MPREGNSGWARTTETFHAPVAAGTGAEEYLTDLVEGYTYVIENVKAVVEVAGTGAGATRLFRVLKGASTVVASATITLAGTATKGIVIDLPVTQANALFQDADQLSIDVTGAGTSFTALTLQFMITKRTRPQQAVV